MQPTLNIRTKTLHLHLAPRSELSTELLSTAAQICSAPGFTERFTLSHDGVLATDHQTGLMWPVYESESSMDFDDLQKYVAAFRLGGFDDWFVPSDEQHCSIIDRTRYAPAFAGPLKSRSNSWEWTSTPYLPAGKTAAGVPAAFWQVYGNDGDLNGDRRYYGAFARPCRFVARAGQ